MVSICIGYGYLPEHGDLDIHPNERAVYAMAIECQKTILCNMWYPQKESSCSNNGNQNFVSENLNGFKSDGMVNLNCEDSSITGNCAKETNLSTSMVTVDQSSIPQCKQNSSVGIISNKGIVDSISQVTNADNTDKESGIDPCDVMFFPKKLVCSTPDRVKEVWGSSREFQATNHQKSTLKDFDCIHLDSQQQTHSTIYPDSPGPNDLISNNFSQDKEMCISLERDILVSNTNSNTTLDIETASPVNGLCKEPACDGDKVTEKHAANNAIKIMLHDIGKHLEKHNVFTSDEDSSTGTTHKADCSRSKNDQEVLEKNNNFQNMFCPLAEAISALSTEYNCQMLSGEYIKDI